VASTTGGFFIGFGLCLLVSLGAYAVLGQYSSQIMEWRDEVGQVYAVTHSHSCKLVSRCNKLDPCISQYASL